MGTKASQGVKGETEGEAGARCQVRGTRPRLRFEKAKASQGVKGETEKGPPGAGKMPALHRRSINYDWSAEASLGGVASGTGIMLDKARRTRSGEIPSMQMLRRQVFIMGVS